MNIPFLLILITLARWTSAHVENATTIEVLQNIFFRCANNESVFSCMRPKVLAYLSTAAEVDKLTLTEDLEIIRSRNLTESNGNKYYDPPESPRKEVIPSLMLNKIDSYLLSHSLKISLPETILSSGIIPRSLFSSEPTSICIPLLESSNGNGRGFIKKVMIPFLLGLKFKATALVPLALALIALKTWKALTLGLLSLVLSGAMMIFKLTKPKVAYEVIHYGHPPIDQTAHWDGTASHGPYRSYY